MKQALVDGQLALATPVAPAMAICPHCDSPVTLRQRHGTYFWRHVGLPRDGCHPSRPEAAMMGQRDAMADAREPWVRQVGDLVIELHLDARDGLHVKLRSLSTEAAGEMSGLRINPGEVHPLTEALLDVAREIERTAVSFSNS